MNYYIRNRGNLNLFLTAQANSEDVIMDDEEVGYQRWVFEKVDLYKYRVIFSSANKPIQNDRRFLCINDNKNKWIVKSSWNSDRCKLHIIRESLTSDYFYIRPDCCSSRYLWKTSGQWTLYEDDLTTGANRVRWRFDLLDPYIDYPVVGKTYKIRNYKKQSKKTNLIFFFFKEETQILIKVRCEC